MTLGFGISSSGICLHFNICTHFWYCVIMTVKDLQLPLKILKTNCPFTVLSNSLKPVRFALRHLPCSYLLWLYWVFHFLPLWLNICFSQLSGDIKQIQGVRFNFEVFISSPICCWNVCSSTLICIGRQKQTLLSVLITPLSHQHQQSPPPSHGWKMCST